MRLQDFLDALSSKVFFGKHVLIFDEEDGYNSYLKTDNNCIALSVIQYFGMPERYLKPELLDITVKEFTVLSNFDIAVLVEE